VKKEQIPFSQKILEVEDSLLAQQLAAVAERQLDSHLNMADLEVVANQARYQHLNLDKEMREELEDSLPAIGMQLAVEAELEVWV
jgi:regulator of protease activity HflC (stomatin/prohibitin superfamily)